MTYGREHEAQAVEQRVIWRRMGPGIWCGPRISVPSTCHAYSEDSALASKSAAAFAASSVSAVPLAIRSSRLPPALALRLSPRWHTVLPEHQQYQLPDIGPNGRLGPRGRQRLPF